jgi:hypothetical protein
VDPVPDPALIRNFGSAGNRTWTSGSVACNSNHWATATASASNTDTTYVQFLNGHVNVPLFVTQGISLSM